MTTSVVIKHYHPGILSYINTWHYDIHRQSLMSFPSPRIIYFIYNNIIIIIIVKHLKKTKKNLLSSFKFTLLSKKKKAEHILKVALVLNLKFDVFAC